MTRSCVATDNGASLACWLAGWSSRSVAIALSASLIMLCFINVVIEFSKIAQTCPCHEGDSWAYNRSRINRHTTIFHAINEFVVLVAIVVVVSLFSLATRPQSD